MERSWTKFPSSLGHCSHPRLLPVPRRRPDTNGTTVLRASRWGKLKILHRHPTRATPSKGTVSQPAGWAVSEPAAPLMGPGHLTWTRLGSPYTAREVNLARRRFRVLIPVAALAIVAGAASGCISVK